MNPPVLLMTARRFGSTFVSLSRVPVSSFTISVTVAVMVAS